MGNLIRLRRLVTATPGQEWERGNVKWRMNNGKLEFIDRYSAVSLIVFIFDPGG
jgi:hypothetical protein